MTMNTPKTHYSCAELAGMALPNRPTTERAWLSLVKREQWLFIEIRSKGRGGIRREYEPPAHVACEIAHHLATGSTSRSVPALGGRGHKPATGECECAVATLPIHQFVELIGLVDPEALQAWMERWQ